MVKMIDWITLDLDYFLYIVIGIIIIVLGISIIRRKIKLGKKKEKKDDVIKELEAPKPSSSPITHVLKEEDEAVFELPHFEEIKKLKEKESQIDERYIEIEEEIRDVYKKTETILEELDDMAEDIKDTVTRLKNIYSGINKKKATLLKSLTFEE